MKLNLFIFLFIFLFVLSSNISAQNKSEYNKRRTIDSLKREINWAKHDTDKIKLSAVIGKIIDARHEYWDSLLLEARSFKMHRTEIFILWRLGFCYWGLDDIKPLKCFSEALVIAEQKDLKVEQCSTFCFLASYYEFVSKLDKALEFSYRALKSAEEIKNTPMIGGSNEIIAAIYARTGNYNGALKAYATCLRIYKQLNERERILYTILGIGNTYASMGDRSTAVSYYLEGPKYMSEIGENNPIGFELYSSIGASHLIGKKYDSAEFYFRKALKISETIGQKRGVASAKSHLANNYYYQGDTKRAAPLAQEALSLAKEIGFKAQVVQTTLVLMNIYLKDKNYKKALESYSLHIATRDSSSNENNRNAVREKQYAYNFEKKENENKLLAQQNQIQALDLKQKNNFMLGLGSVLLLVIVIGYLFFRQNKLKALQQSSALEQKLLRLQMNPHFIFNSLQAIQSYVLKNNPDEASEYISAFANVTRNVLENSRIEAIPLKKEIGLLENYLRLQQLRFKKRFTCQIKVDENLDTEAILVPPMLAQPFIENAVEHGFHNIENDGKIEVFYTLKDFGLLIEISDNGNGMSNGQWQGKQHQSLSLEITKERVALMNKKAGGRVKFEIEEAFPQNKDRKGVKVKFSIPVAL